QTTGGRWPWIFACSSRRVGARRICDRREYPGERDYRAHSFANSASEEYETVGSGVSQRLRRIGDPPMATILVVDDEKNYRWMLEELLEGEEHDVLTCEKVSDALEVLRESRIDLLLTDLRMSETDGMTLLAQAREISPTTTTILMTAYGTIERA